MEKQPTKIEMSKIPRELLLSEDDPMLLDVAIETIATLIGMINTKINSEVDPLKKKLLSSRKENLRIERELMYVGDKNIIDKILNQYSSEIRDLQYNGGI